MTAFDQAWVIVKAVPLKWYNTTAGEKWLTRTVPSASTLGGK